MTAHNPMDDDLTADLRAEAEALQRLMNDAQDLQRQIYEHLDRVQHGGKLLWSDEPKTLRTPN